MAEHGAQRGAVRQAIASLLRLAHADARDARTLAEAGGTRNAASLLHSAISRLIEAVVASEQGYTGPPEIRRIDSRNPLKPSLLRLEAFLETPSALQRDGRLAEPPPATSVLEPLGAFAETLERFVQYCGVDLDGSGPAETVEPMRPAVEAPPPPSSRRSPKPRPVDTARRQAPRVQPPQARSRAKVVATTAEAAVSLSPEAAPTDDPKPTAHPSYAGLTSGTFWSLVDRWSMADLDALQLIGHGGGLTRTGTRPRFKLSEGESEIVSAMRSLDATLAQLGLDPAEWLAAPLRPEPFRGTSPLAVIQQGHLQGLRQVSRFLTQMSLRLSLKQS